MRQSTSSSRTSLHVVVTGLLLAALSGALPADVHAGCNVGEWGPLCTPCPGGSATPCNLHGTCDEGPMGTGNCSCNAGYTGTACDACGPDFYNYPACTYCSAMSTCSGNGTCNVNGTCNCNVGIVGTACDQCAPGYTGYPACTPIVTTTSTTTSTTTTTTLPADGCAATPRLDCLDPGKALLSIKDNADDTKDLLLWKWGKGEAFAQAATDDPSATATYTLCLYDSVADVFAEAGSLSVGPGSNWTDLDPKGWKYKDADATADGVTLLQVGSGAADKTKAALKAKGLAVPLPAPASGTQFFALDSSVTVQLRNSDTDVCWSSTFTTAKTNTPAKFLAKLP